MASTSSSSMPRNTAASMTQKDSGRDGTSKGAATAESPVETATAGICTDRVSDL